MPNAMDGKNINNRRCSEELWSFTSCSIDELGSDGSTDREHASMASGLATILDYFSAFLACICPAKYFLFLSSSLERCKQLKDISMSDAQPRAEGSWHNVVVIQEPTKWCSLWRVLWQCCSAFCWKNIWSLGTESQKDKEIPRRYKFCSSTCVRNPKRLL